MALPATLFAVWLAGAAAAEEITSIPAIFERPKAFDNKTLCIQGPTDTLFQKYSRHGHHYFTVWLSGGGKRIKVFGFGAPTFSQGETIEACGRYQRTKTRSGRIFYDEFTAGAILKGPAMGSGKVVLAEDGVHGAPGAAATPPPARP